MDKKWKKYEQAVYEECQEWASCSYTDWKVEKDVHIQGKYSGQTRQIDILMTSSGEEPTKIVVEAKYYSTKVSVKTVDSFIGFLEDVGIENGLIVCEEGYTPAAIKRAHKGTHAITVEILSMKELKENQGKCGMMHIGKSILLFMAPFGWIADFTPLPFFKDPAIMLYRRGLSVGEAVHIEKEYMLLMLKKREHDGTLFHMQMEDELKIASVDEDASVRYYGYHEKTNLSYRIVNGPKWQEKITVYCEFRSFIAVVYVVCSELYEERDLRKALSFLDESFEHNGN